MFSISKSTRFLQIAAAAWLFSGASLAFAQQPSKDDELERLLEKTQEAKQQDLKNGESGGSKPAGTSQDKPKPGDAKPGEKKGRADDQELDSLLEKLGQTGDDPTTKGKPQAPPPGADTGLSPPPDSRKAQKQADQIDPEKRSLDQHLEDLAGKKRKPNKDDEAKSDPSQGPLAEAIKKIREVEQRLGQDDTGESTRKRQEEIVKDLEQLIKMAKQQSSGQQKGGRGRQQAQAKPGQDPNNPNDDPKQGTDATKPKTPSPRDVLAENKDIWGHLPPEMRAELENSFKEEPLPKNRELIDRYYLSVTRKSAADRRD